MTEQTQIKRPVLRYHGGKFKLAKWIISHFPEHRIYVEPFGGGGSVLMQKPRAYAEVYNDLWDTVVNVFQVLRNPTDAELLEKAIRLTPYSRTEFDKTGEIYLSEISDPIEKARLTILRSFAGFGSAATNAKYATGFRSNSNRSGTTPAHDWVNYPNHISSFIQRLQGVVIENRDYEKVCLQHDSENTLFYVDPPYLHSTRNMNGGNKAYACELTDSDHIKLSQSLKSLKGMVIVSGYNSDLYEQLYLGWIKIERKAFADGAAERTEVLWISPNCETKIKIKLMNQKEEIKAEKKAVNEAVKNGLKEWIDLEDRSGIISEVALSDIELPSIRLLNSRMIETIFNDQKEKFYNREFSKLQTELKNSAKAIGRLAFEYQYKHLNDNAETEIKNKAFTREETLRAYELVFEELYKQNLKAA